MNFQIAQTFQRGSFSTDDPSEFEMAVQPWDLLIDSRDQGKSKFGLDFISIPGLSVLRESYGDDVRLIGMPPPGHLVLAIPFGGDGQSIAYGEPVIDHQLYSLAGDPLEVRYRSGQTVLTIEIAIAQVFEPTLELAMEKLASRGRHSAFSTSPQNVRAIARKLEELFPPAYTNRATPTKGTADVIREFVEDALIDAVLPDRFDSIHGKKVGQNAAVVAALEYLRTPNTECASVAALCEAVGVNKRTLERGVREKFNCTVVHLLQKWRMHAARRRLLEAGPQDTTVAHIATSLGFYDLGRFASRYRYRFGEYPSDTLSAASRWVARQSRSAVPRRAPV